MAQVFISYKRLDKDIVFPIKNQIEAAIGKNTCWIDVTGIESDARFVEVIMKNIDACSVFLFMYSKLHSQITNSDDWTMRELIYAKDLEKHIVFINIDDSPLKGLVKFMFPFQQLTSANSPEEMARLRNNLKTWISDTPTQPATNNTYSVRFGVFRRPEENHISSFVSFPGTSKQCDRSRLHPNQSDDAEPSV